MLWYALAQLISTFLESMRVVQLSSDEKDLEILILRQQLDVMVRKNAQVIRPGRLERWSLAAGEEEPNSFPRAHGTGVAVQAIMQEGLAGDQPPNVRAEAAAILGEPGLPEAIPWLVEVLEDDYPHVRAKARASLRRIGTPEAMRALQEHPLAGMVYIAAGRFKMGDDEGSSDEKPAHEVHVDAFYIGKHPVTNADYASSWSVRGARRPTIPTPREGWAETYTSNGATRRPSTLSFFLLLVCITTQKST